MSTGDWCVDIVYPDGRRWELFVDGRVIGRVMRFATGEVSGWLSGDDEDKEGFEDFRHAARWLMKQAGVW